MSPADSISGEQPSSFFERHSTFFSSLVWSLGAIFYFYEIMLIVAPSVMDVEIMKAFSITGKDFGKLAGSYYIPYALMQIPVGLFMDKYGPRLLLTLASLFCALGCVILATAHVYYFGMAGRVLMGVGGSFAVVGCLKLASIWFPVNRFALLTGVMVALGMMGAVFGQTLVAELVEYIGWRETLLSGAAVGVGLALLIFLLMGYKPKYVQEFVPETSKQSMTILSGLKKVIVNPQVWVASVFACLLFLPTTGFAQLWGVSYLTTKFEITRPEAGWSMAMLFFGWAFGGPIFGWISDKIGSRKLPMYVGSAGTLVVMTMILYLDVSLNETKALLFFLGGLSSCFILAFSVVREINVHETTGTAIGFINTLNNISGALAQPIIGKLLDMNWDGTMLDNSPVYSIENFNTAFIFLPVALVIGFILLPLIKETHCRPIFYKPKGSMI